jgi:diguanylate cyclase (GGDEF)-like protein/putative nucleotidyltransferase with HDIG domain
MTESHREYYIKIYRRLLIVGGLGVIGLVTARLIREPFDPRWLAMMAFAVVGSWLAASQIPGAKSVVTVSDTFIFLTMLLCGPEAATLVAAAAAASDSARHVKYWLTLATNVAVICCSFFISSWLLTLIFGDLRLLAHHKDTFFIYVLALGAFAALQAVVNSFLVIVVIALKTNRPLLQVWREGYSWVVVTYFSGVLTAGVVNALIHYYGFAAVGFTIPVLLANYLAYRPYLKNIEDARRHVEETRALHMRTLEAFATAVDAKDQITHEHVQRVQTYAEGVARLLSLSEKEIEALRAGALLHDIGKLAVPDYILNKPGRLTAAEFDKMKIHTIVGAQILERINFPYPLVPVVRHHHERWDGTGYPDGLKGEEIPLTARILTVVDCFDAVREDRQYRRGLTREEAIEFLRRDKSKHYDPQIVDLFIENLPQFEAQIAQMKKGEHVFTPLELDETEAIRKAKPAAGLAEEQTKPTAEKPAEYLQTIRAAHQASQEILALYEIAQTFTSSLDVRDTLAIVVSKLERIIPFDTCAVYLHDEAQRAAVAQHVTGLHSESFRGRAIEPGEGVTGWVLANNRPFANTDPALDLQHLGEHATDYKALAVYPLTKGDRQFGALALYSQVLTTYTEEQLRTLERVASLTSDALHNAMLYAETRANALADPLTGLPNSRFLHMVFEQEQSRRGSDEHPLTLLTMDLDGFRQINAALGHKLGDRIIKEIGELIRGQLRREDTLIRYAGDEFMALLCNTPTETISEIAVRIQATVAEYHPVVLEGSGLRLGLSIGQSRLGEDGQALEQLLEAAEIRLQADKAARRSLKEWAASTSTSKVVHELEV